MFNALLPLSEERIRALWSCFSSKVSSLYLNVRWFGIKTLKGFQIEYGQSE